jgi:hypothetical protein
MIEPIKPVWWDNSDPTNCDVKFAVCLNAIRHKRLTYTQYNWLDTHISFIRTFGPGEMHNYLLYGKHKDD